MEKSYGSKTKGKLVFSYYVWKVGGLNAYSFPLVRCVATILYMYVCMDVWTKIPKKSTVVQLWYS